jgi:hypothetical protein
MASCSAERSALRSTASIRDLFDVKRLLDREVLTDEVRLGAIAGLVSHGRPIAGVVDPARKVSARPFGPSSKACHSSLSL